MKPTINTSHKGKLIIQNQSIDHDFYINAEGRIEKRKTGDKIKDQEIRTLSLHEAEECYDPTVNELIIGCDDKDKLMISNEATDFFEEKRLKIKVLPIDEAVVYWNRYEGHAVGLFHLPRQ